MNTDQHYVRRDDRALPMTAAEPEPTATEADVPRLATHRDPSLATGHTAAPTTGGGAGLAWVRPTELAATLGSSVTRRAIDLETELARRVRRTPVTATRAAYRATQPHVMTRRSEDVVARPTSPAIEGPGLA